MEGSRAAKLIEPRLILLNGAPGIGKSTLARRYVADHPLTLLLEIDAVRVALGGWQDHAESKLLARAIALAMAETQLRFGYDVIVPQFLGRTEYVEALDHLAASLQVDFVEILLRDDRSAIADRFLARRLDHAGHGHPHPEGDVADTAITATIATALDQLDAVATERPRTRTVEMTPDSDATYRALRAAIG